MIEESYVSLETAQLLKEAGFDLPCEKWFELKDGTPVEWGADASCNWNVSKDDFSRPTLSLAAKWLRETHGIHVSSNIFMDSANDADGNTVDEWNFWSYDLFDNSGRIIEESDDRYDSYEEALEAGLKRGLKVIKK